MNILLTNDDGVSAAGLNTLYQALLERHTVYIIAPHREKSACSNAITVRHPLKMETLAENRFAVHGYPADCVNIGLHGNIIPEVDLVISGINNGPNLGDDVTFSGTVAGARTAFVFGYSSIAMSIDCMGSSDYFGDAAQFILNFIEDFKLFTQEHPVFLNINYPDLPQNEIRGVRYTTLGKRIYQDSYRVMEESETERTLQLSGTISSLDREGSDLNEVRRGYISITPLTLDSTDHFYLEKLKKMEYLWLK